MPGKNSRTAVWRRLACGSVFCCVLSAAAQQGEVEIHAIVDMIDAGAGSLIADDRTVTINAATEVSDDGGDSLDIGEIQSGDSVRLTIGRGAERGEVIAIRVIRLSDDD